MLTNIGTVITGKLVVGVVFSKKQMLIEANSKPHGMAIHTDGSVTRDRSG